MSLSKLTLDVACRLAAPALVALVMAGLPAQAAAVPVKGKGAAVTALAQKDPEITGSVQKAADAEPNCAQSRKRLWVEGEGWVVRRVTTCY